MRGFPKHINSKTDIENLISMPEHLEKALKKLEEIQKVDDSKVVIDVTPADADLDAPRKIKIIDNPKPLYKRLGFEEKSQVDELTSIETKLVSRRD